MVARGTDLCGSGRRGLSNRLDPVSRLRVTATPCGLARRRLTSWARGVSACPFRTGVTHGWPIPEPDVESDSALRPGSPVLAGRGLQGVRGARRGGPATRAGITTEDAGFPAI